MRLVRDGEQEDVYVVRARLHQRLKQAIEFVSFDTNDQTFDPMWEAPHLVELTDKLAPFDLDCGIFCSAFRLVGQSTVEKSLAHFGP